MNSNFLAADYRIALFSFLKSWRYNNYGVDLLAGYLRNKNISVDVFYSNGKYDFLEAIKLINCEYDLFGFSVDSSNYSLCISLAEYIKSINENSSVVFGGSFATRYYREIFLKTDAIDYIVLGDGEKPFESLIQKLRINEKNITIEHVVTRFKYTGATPSVNKNISYFPIYDYFKNDIYEKNIRKEYCIQTKNNVCTGNCSFCTGKKGHLYYKDIEHVVDDIQSVFEKYGTKKFFITDDNILDPNTTYAKDRVSKLCDEINNRNLNLVFKCYIKANSLCDTLRDNNLLKKMFKTGFMSIFVGIESGNQNDLALYNKMTSVEDNYNIIRILKKNGICPQIGFININPYSTLESLRQNYFFLTNIKMTNLFMCICSYMRIYKYTKIYEKMKADKLLIDKYDYIDDKSLYRFLDSKVEEIFYFAKENMFERVKSLPLEFDYLYSFYLETNKINPKAYFLGKKLESIRVSQIRELKNFFYVLLVENDIRKSRKLVNTFLCFFEDLQPTMLDIYKELLLFYTSTE